MDKLKTLRERYGPTLDKVQNLENQVRNKNAEIKTIKEKIPFKSTDDIDKEILRLNKQMDIGKLTLVEEINRSV
ncbi:MAG: hypothetical protein M1828_004769 [Chrysothrix sp. TS-e1954]|nr:MAG: hypothetical protein M1828_004769 [Chrysothrix sp. TS-e1954]